MKKLMLALALALPLLAQEPAAKKEAEPEKDMTVWMWANFAILAGGLVYLSRKHGGPFFAARAESIRKDIADSEKIKADANARASEVKEKLANLGAEIARMQEENARDQAREKERVEARHQAELARVRSQMQQEIESATKLARMELQQQAARLALDLAEKKVAARMNPDMQKRLATEFVESLPQ